MIATMSAVLTLTQDTLQMIVEEEDSMNYYAVLYKNDKIIPIPFNSWKEADDFIHQSKLHAYVIIK